MPRLEDFGRGNIGQLGQGFLSGAIQAGQFAQRSELIAMQQQKQQMELDAVRQQQETLHRPQNIRNSVLYLSLPEDKREEFFNIYTKGGYGDPDGTTSMFKRNQFLSEHKQGVDFLFQSISEAASMDVEKAFQALKTAQMSGDQEKIDKATKAFQYASAHAASVGGAHKEAMGMLAGEKSTDMTRYQAERIRQEDERIALARDRGVREASEAPEEPLTEDAAQMISEASQLGIRIPMPALGMGASGARIKILNQMAKDLAANGGDVTEFGLNSALRSSLSGALTQQEKVRGMMGSFVRNLDKQVVRMKQISGDIVKRFGLRAIDLPARQLRMRAVGSGNEAIIEAYLTEISNEIGKLSTGSAASVQELSQSAQEKWARIHDPNLSLKELTKILDETREMGSMRLNSADEEIARYHGLIRNIGRSSPAPSPIVPQRSSSPSGLPEGTVDNGDGTFTLPNGTRIRKKR